MSSIESTVRPTGAVSALWRNFNDPARYLPTRHAFMPESPVPPLDEAPPNTGPAYQEIMTQEQRYEPETPQCRVFSLLLPGERRYRALVVFGVPRLKYLVSWALRNGEPTDHLDLADERAIAGAYLMFWLCSHPSIESIIDVVDRGQAQQWRFAVSNPLTESPFMSVWPISLGRLHVAVHSTRFDDPASAFSAALHLHGQSIGFLGPGSSATGVH